MHLLLVTMATILAQLGTMQGQKLKRDTLARATCTAPGATKGETAVVTCRYPLDVKQPGKMVSISVEHYPFISASPEFPSRDYLLECVWQEDGEEYCTVKKEEYRVEGKEVVITIKNVIEDNQGRYLCKMMVKDGPNIHGDACRLLVNGTNPSDLLPSTTDPALDQQTPRDNVTSSAGQMAAGEIAGIVVGVVAVAVVLALVCVWRKRRNAAHKAQYQPTTTKMKSIGSSCHYCTEESWDSSDDHATKSVLGKRKMFEAKLQIETAFSELQPTKQHLYISTLKDDAENSIKGGNKQHLEEKGRLVEGKEDQHPHSDQEKPGAQSQVNEDDVNNGHRHPAERDWPMKWEGNQLLQQPNQEGPGAEDQGDNDDDNRGNGPPEERDLIWGWEENQLPYQDPERPGARDERNNGDVTQFPALTCLSGKGHPERDQIQRRDAESPKEQASGDNVDNNHGHGPPAEREQPVEGEGNQLLPQPNQEGPGAEHQGDNDDDDRQQGSSDDRPESCVGKQVNRIEVEGAPSTSHPRASNEMEETEKAYGEEEKENDANETDDLFAHHMEHDAGKRRGPPAEGSIGKPTSGHKPLAPLQHNRNTPPPRHPTNHLSHSTPHPPAYDWTSPFIHRPDNHPTLVPRSTEHYPSIDHSSPINHMDVVAK